VAIAWMLAVLAIECPREIFDKAIASHSASPSYVLVTVVNEATKKRATVCFPAPVLLIAIRDELGLKDDDGGNAKVEQFARERDHLVFHFGKHKAWKRVTPLYDKGILEDVETRLAGLSTEKLRESVADPQAPLHRIYRESQNWPAYRDAVAHVLLEHCVAVRFAERTGALELAP
jgi:hypothetical protein